MATKYHKVRTVNPAPKKRRKMATRKKRKTTTKRRRAPARRRNPAPRASKPRRRYRRRSNPGMFGGAGPSLKAPFKDWKPLWMLVGKMAGVWAVRKWGDPESSPASTATMGGRWSIKNHIINMAAAYFFGSAVGKWKSGNQGQWILDGAVELSVSKAFWHEVIQAVPGGTKYFGNTEGPMRQLMAQAQDGDTIDDGRGNRYLVKGSGVGKKLVPMMGLQQERALDGLQPARPLDGLTTATAMDGYQGRLRRGEALGHYQPLDEDDDDNVYIRRGTRDPYQAAYIG